jgi:hypothetical protein
VLDAVQLRCPQLTSLFNLFYTVDGACFYTVDGVVELVWSAEGVRMGCPLGSFGFDLALQGPLERCAARSRSTVVRSLTDDCNLAVLLPSDREEAKAVVLEMRATLAELEADAKTNLNLDLNLGKCAAAAAGPRAAAGGPGMLRRDQAAGARHACGGRSTWR